MAKNSQGEPILLRETAFTREVTLRVDRFGCYLLFWQAGSLVAGITWQRRGYEHLIPGFSLLAKAREAQGG